MSYGVPWQGTCVQVGDVDGVEGGEGEGEGEGLRPQHRGASPLLLHHQPGPRLLHLHHQGVGEHGEVEGGGMQLEPPQHQAGGGGGQSRGQLGEEMVEEGAKEVTLRRWEWRRGSTSILSRCALTPR